MIRSIIKLGNEIYWTRYVKSYCDLSLVVETKRRGEQETDEQVLNNKELNVVSKSGTNHIYSFHALVSVRAAENVPDKIVSWI